MTLPTSFHKTGQDCLLKAAFFSLKFLNFTNSLFTSDSFKAMGILLLQNSVLFYVLHIVNSFPLYQQISPDLHTPSGLFLN